MIESPVTMLDPAVSRASIMENLIHEVYEYVAASLLPSHQARNRRSAPSPLDLAHRILRAKSEDAQLHIVMDWLEKLGLSAADTHDEETRRFFRVFIRHAQIIENAKIEPVLAPVHYWSAKHSWLTSAPISAGLRARTTSNTFTQTAIEGRHFELMDEPLVRTLATQIDRILQSSQAAPPAESPAPTQLVAEKSIKPRIAALRRP
jgi:thioesterase domain-containing protein